jgi:hypothetical protein|tara:strand:+ start:106 stop:333 length:228 start_codon:yes stop_codon:yes gene_type:complete
MEIRESLINALKLKYDAQIAEHSANIAILLQNGVGVAEHPGIIETIDGEVGLLAEAEDKRNSIGSFSAPIPPKVV